MRIRKTVSKIVLLNPAKQILFLFRSDSHLIYGGQLDLPGGIVEKNELPINAAQRELLEETGIMLSNNPVLLRHLEIKTVSEEIAYYLFCATTTFLDESNIKLSNEHKAFVLLTKEEINKYDISKLTDNYIIEAIKFLKQQNPTN